MSRTAITVTQLNQYLKQLLDSDLNLRNIWVSGEISNLTFQQSGHIYFRLKDENGLISGVMFRSSAAKLRFKPENGMKVLALGSISLYEKSGSYQLYVTELKEDGIGDLYVAFEQLKKQLAAAGIFDPAHKKKLPAVPLRIGVITSPTGAAVRDIIQITGRRFPLAEVLVYPAIVQGDQAPQSLVAGVDFFDSAQNVDVIIIGRGGGSIEDLWGFNDPSVALAVYNCSIPIVSAVGHETDFTICDFAADLRAPTPSGAAELVVPDMEELLEQLKQSQKRLSNGLTYKMQQSRERLERYTNARIFKDPKAFTDKPFMHLDRLCEKLNASVHSDLLNRKNILAKNIVRLDALSPLKVMQRGFAYAQDDAGDVVSDIDQLKLKDHLTLRLANGKAGCIVDSIEKD